MATPDIIGGRPLDGDSGTFIKQNVPLARDGLDTILFVHPLNQQLLALEDNMKAIMAQGNLGDTEKQFNLQQLMNTWSAIAQGMTNMLKAVADVNKAIVRNIE